MARRTRQSQQHTRETGSARAMRRFLVMALVLLAVFFCAFTRVPFFDRHVVAPYTLYLARSMTLVLRVVGTSPVEHGASVSTASFSATIVPACAGIEIMAVLVAVILAFPAPFRYKWTGVAWGLAAVHVVNVGRLTVLFLIGIHFRSTFDQAHFYYAQGLLLLATVGVWALWVSSLPHHGLETR